MICTPATIGVPVLAVALPGSGPVAAVDRVLVAVHVLAVTVWVGGLVAIFVVARVASRTLDPAARVAFFRGLGRAYGPVGGIALIVALASGAVLVDRRPWDGLLSAAVAVATGLVLVTVAGVLQARTMTRLRYRALEASAGDGVHARVARGALLAGALRAAIGFSPSRSLLSAWCLYIERPSSLLRVPKSGAVRLSGLAYVIACKHRSWSRRTLCAGAQLDEIRLLPRTRGWISSSCCVLRQLGG